MPKLTINKNKKRKPNFIFATGDKNYIKLSLRDRRFKMIKVKNHG